MMIIVLAIGLMAGACQTPSSTTVSDLRPTLTLPGPGTIPMQSGIPVPSFSYQPRSRLDLVGAWRFQPAHQDENLSLTRRPAALPRIVEAAAGREKPAYDDSGWGTIRVPGTLRPPPHGGPYGGWYRLSFVPPAGWSEKAITLKFSSANYLADVWLNGHYLGYHEGGSTPFAFDVSQQLQVGARNVLAVRLDDPIFGSRNDVVPWGIVDWWNYAGLTGPIWLEAGDNLQVARADVTPYLDRVDLAIVLENRGRSPVTAAAIDVTILPAAVTDDNVLDPDPRHLVPTRAVPLGTVKIEAGQMQGQSAARHTASFALSHPDLWLPERPSLYVLHVTARRSDAAVDDFYDTFGLRRIQVDPHSPRLLLNGRPVAFHGVSIQDEETRPPVAGQPSGGPVTTPEQAYRILQQVRAVHADFIRADHRPANPLLLMLADRLGFAIWEELPLYHFTPQTFTIAMKRGIPQQMLAEMDLRDYNRASVLFHGLANESSGQSERVSALDELQRLDHSLDGTRLTGQAMNGLYPNDPTSRSLDVAAYTFYYGVLYGPNIESGTQAALASAHRTYPNKPVMILEFGRWSDNADQDALQAEVFQKTYSLLAANFDTLPQGFVGGVAWWALNDYWTDLPGISVERFGLFRPDGSPRPAAAVAAELYGSAEAGRGPDLKTISGGQAVAVQPQSAGMLTAYLAYGLAVPSLIVLLLTLLVGIAARRRLRRAA
jgi:beta-glucuronidase